MLFATSPPSEDALSPVKRLFRRLHAHPGTHRLVRSESSVAASPEV
jgi:hypothetical protein